MMALTGICLVLFVTFHVLMNSVALFARRLQPGVRVPGRQLVCPDSFGRSGLIFIIHIIYALWLTIPEPPRTRQRPLCRQRRRPRRGVVVEEHASSWHRNSAFLVVHMIQFWSKMQLQELLSHELTVLPQVDGVPASPAMGTLFLQMAFSQWWTPWYTSSVSWHCGST